MSPKPPPKGPFSVDIHPRPRPPSEGHTPLPDTLPRVDFGSPVTTNPRNPSRTTGTPEDGDLDAITPAPTVTASERPSVPVPASTAAQRPLEHYWIASAAQLPVPDDLGVRTFKGRQYVDVPGGGVVHIEADPDTGLYRAKLPSELQASGPVLVRDSASTLWHPVDEVGSTTYPLTATRLEAFRTHLDFTGVEPGDDGLYRHDGKLYVVIENRTYQALHDLEASSPQAPVMRIVRAEDPVALDDRNVYVATRPGRSEPVVYASLDGWVGTHVGAKGGMHRRANPAADRAAIASVEVVHELDRLDSESDQAMAISERLQSDWEAVRGTQGERNALILREIQHQRELGILEKTVTYYTDNKADIVALYRRDGYRAKLIHLQQGRILAYERILEVNFLRQLLAGPITAASTENLPSVAAFLTKKLTYMKKRQEIEDELVKKWRVPPSDLHGDVLSPMEVHEVVALWMYAKSRLLSNDQSATTAFEAPYLAAMFSQTTTAYGAIDNIPESARSAVLSELLDQSIAIRDSYDRLALPPEPKHATSRDEITGEIKAFEHTLEEHLARYHLEQIRNSALPAHEQSIDFDFIPAQDRSGAAPRPSRMFRARHHGVYKINVGHPRQSDTGVQVIDVMSPGDPIQVMHTYERQEGEWRRLRPVQNTALPELMAQATQRLDQFDSHLGEARRDERAKRNATNIVEFLGGKAETLDDLARQLEHAPNPTGNNIAPLVQRLRDHSHRLRTEGEDIRIRLYKDKAFLGGDRLAYLISQEHIGAVKILDRALRGKGKEKHFLDIYSLNDRHTGEPLWHAHFHYDRKDTLAVHFKDDGGHLKTLEQSGKGISSQRRDEQAGRPHTAIWRPAIDRRTAQRIFDLAT